MATNSRYSTCALWVVMALLAVSTLLMWLPALHTPFWGDDYVFLLKARATALSGAPWWSDFWPSTPVHFWRPLSQEGYWRATLALFGGSAVAMHAINLILHLLASAGVGLLALAVARTRQWQRPGQTAVLAGLLYATLALHMLPVHWAAAANNAMLTLFTSLTLSAWLASSRHQGWRHGLLLACLPGLQLLALLSKESAVLAPLLMVVIGLFAGAACWRRGNLIALAACVLLVLVWLVLDTRFTDAGDASYSMNLGSNVLRNAAAFVAWLLNVPREALRMAMVGNRGQALLWIAATAVPMLMALALAGWRGRTRLTPKQWLGTGLFAALAYGPYFLLAAHSYAYYAAIAAILPVIVLAWLTLQLRRAWVVLVLVALSSWIAVAGTRQVAQPGLIARAQWGEQLLQTLQKQPIPASMWVQVSDPQRFYAVGRAGLAWRLGMPLRSIHTATHCPVTARHCLLIAPSGHWRWRADAADKSNVQQP